MIAPGVDEGGHPYLMRLYSVASAREGEGGAAGHMALTVKRVLSDSGGNPHHGVCSNYLCDVASGGRVKLVGPFGDSFLMPEAPEARLLMIATGTGIAPMRGFIASRRGRGQARPEGLMIFYGGRTLDDLAYVGDLEAMAQAGELDLDLSLSRAADRPRRYVQEALLDRMQDIAGLLADPWGHVFVCGLRGLEKGVLAAFQQCCDANGFDWDAIQNRMKAEGRIHFETY